MLQIQGCNGLQQQEHNISKVNNTTAVSISNTHEKSAGKKSKALHALAEKGRRKRINHHLDTLRHFFPQLPKVCSFLIVTSFFENLFHPIDYSFLTMKNSYRTCWLRE